MMRPFRIRGGVHPEERKDATRALAIEDMPLPGLLWIPLQQHIGSIADALVTPGQRVLKGELLAIGQGPVSAAVHAPTSGTVRQIGPYPAHHASGLSVPTVTLEPDGEERWCEGLAGVPDPFALAPSEIARRVAEAGIVGMGGATFPAAVKLDLRDRYRLHTLVVNGAECEPYLTCDDRLMQERPAEVIDGIRIMAHALGVARVVIAIESNKPEAQAALRGAAAQWPEIRVAQVPTRYPMGSERHLVQYLTGREAPARGLTAEIGVVVHNPATAFAVHEALRTGRPLIERVVTVSGGALARPRNLRVRLGTSVGDVLEHCGGLTEAGARLISGGPMMGQPILDPRVPVVKGCNGLLGLTVRESRPREPTPCIRCGSCVSVCPCGLLPLELVARARADDLDGVVDAGLLDCLGCGSCAYVCPAHLPMVQFIHYAKGAVAERARAKEKQRWTKELAAQRSARIAAIQRAKREAMAKRKQAAAAKPPAESAEAGAP